MKYNQPDHNEINQTEHNFLNILYNFYKYSNGSVKWLITMISSNDKYYRSILYVGEIRTSDWYYELASLEEVIKDSYALYILVEVSFYNYEIFGYLSCSYSYDALW